MQKAFDELEAHAIASGFPLVETFVGIPWDDMEITSDAKCRFDAGILVPHDVFIPRTINQQTLPAGRYAILRFEIAGHDFDLPWTRLMRDWLPGSVYQPADGPRFERYLTDGTEDEEGRWQIEISLPVKPL